MVDSPALFSCKWCKKSILMTTAVEHINGCLKIKKEKANRKKAAREARERAKEQALREERERRAEEEGITLGGDGDSGDDDDEEKGLGGKSTKKVGGKKTGDGDLKGKKRKAEGEPDKGPKQKKKKDEPKPKTKPKGELQAAACRPSHPWHAALSSCTSHRNWPPRCSRSSPRMPRTLPQLRPGSPCLSKLPNSHTQPPRLRCLRSPSSILITVNGSMAPPSRNRERKQHIRASKPPRAYYANLR